MLRVLRSRVHVQALPVRLRQPATEARRQRDSSRLLGIVGGHRGESLRTHEIRQRRSVLEWAAAIAQGMLAVCFNRWTCFNAFYFEGLSSLRLWKPNHIRLGAKSLWIRDAIHHTVCLPRTEETGKWGSRRALKTGLHSAFYLNFHFSSFLLTSEQWRSGSCNVSLVWHAIVCNAIQLGNLKLKAR